MNNIVSLYTSLDGRIGRKTWWLWSIALGVVVFIVSWIIDTVLGVNLVAIDPTQSPAAVAAAANGIVQKSAWVSLAMLIIFGLPFLALMVKRRHDKDNSGLDVKIFYGLELLMLLVQGLGLGFGPVGMAFSAVVGIYGIYLLVVLGFLKGTTGSNQYGPDPLVEGAALPA